MCGCDGNFIDSSHVQIDIKKVGLKTKGNDPYASASTKYGCGIMMRCVASILDSKYIPSLTVEEMRYFDSCPSDVVWQLPEIAKIIDLRAKKASICQMMYCHCALSWP
ncbi:hypothetical protein AVEN_217859-1 [Araneus ventricosus]|uniref:Uncharacterized protein n=1 Tax=Araneus ventricosus TaxID=182803 RepID=A0A4Y2QY16_ARAVE|nr:hypothetical protein AVEN_217859-1 [Araneus ventricosus]